MHSKTKNLDVMVAMGIAVLNITWALLPVHLPVVGIVLALPLIFIIPGYTLYTLYTLTAALFSNAQFRASYRLLFSIGLSLAMTILSGLVLNFFPAGLQTISWAMGLGVITVVLSLVAMYRRRDAPLETAAPSAQRRRIAPYAYGLFGLAAIVTVLAMLYAASGVMQQPRPGFTQLWMQPGTQARQASHSCTVRLGVRSFEATPTTYRMAVTINGTQTAAWSSIALAPQQEWDHAVPIPAGTTNDAYIDVRLYRANTPQMVYRETHISFKWCIR